jgi:hypothetical protein
MHRSFCFFAIILLAACTANMFLFAQVPQNQYDLKLQMKGLNKQADSLRKEAKHLQDSLSYKLGNIFSGDSLLKGWTKDFHFEIPNVPDYRFFERSPHEDIKPFDIKPFKEDEKKKPIEDFKGWYYEKLADRE